MNIVYNIECIEKWIEPYQRGRKTDTDSYYKTLLFIEMQKLADSSNKNLASIKTPDYLINLIEDHTSFRNGGWYYHFIPQANRLIKCLTIR